MSRKNRELEKRLARAVRAQTPDHPQELLRARQNRKAEYKMTTQYAQPVKKRSMTAILTAAAAVLLLLAVGGFWGYRNYLAVASTVGIDVNPSVELQVNRRNKVVKTQARNTEAAQILQEMDLKGSDVTVAVNAVIGAMVRNGYLGEQNNAVLLSVSGADDALRHTLLAGVDQSLRQESIDGAVFSQSVRDNEEAQRIASQYNVSLGKAEWIRALTAANPSWTEETLANCSITDLALLAEGKDTLDGKLESNHGAVSDKKYIGEEQARQKALARVPGAQITSIEMDMEDGRMIYDVEMRLGGTKYEAEVDAATGEIVGWESEPEKDSSGGSASSQEGNGYIGLEKARQIALAKVPGAQVRELEFEWDDDDSVPVYEGELRKDNMEYEFKIHAVTGEILKWKAETAFDPPASASGTAPITYLSTEKAKEIVLANLPGGQITRMELDKDDTPPAYEGKIAKGRIEVSFEIHAVTGEILEWEPEDDD